MLKEKQTVIKLQRIFLKNYICASVRKPQTYEVSKIS